MTAGGPSERGKILSQLGGVTVYCVAPELDYAVLQVPRMDFKVNFLPLKRRAPVTGERSVAIGNPAGQGNQLLTRTISEGIVSGVQRNISGVDYIQTTAAVNPGNSGGPLIGENGGLIGMVTRKMASADNIGFALSVNLLESSFREKSRNNTRLGDEEELKKLGARLIECKFSGPPEEILAAYSPFVWRQLGAWISHASYAWMDPDRRPEIREHLEGAYGKKAPEYLLRRLEQGGSLGRYDLRTFQRLFLEEAIAQTGIAWRREAAPPRFKLDNRGLFAHLTWEFDAKTPEGKVVPLVDLQCWQNAGTRWYLYSSHLAEQDKLPDGKDDFLPSPPGALLPDFFTGEDEE